MLQISSLFINGKQKWARFDMHGNFIEQIDAPGNIENWDILCETILLFLLIAHCNMH